MRSEIVNGDGKIVETVDPTENSRRLDTYDLQGRLTKSITTKQTDSGSEGSTVVIYDATTGQVAERHEYDQNGIEKAAADNAVGTNVANGATTGAVATTGNVTTENAATAEVTSASASAEQAPAPQSADQSTVDQAAAEKAAADKAAAEKAAADQAAAEKAAADKAARQAAADHLRRMEEQAAARRAAAQEAAQRERLAAAKAASDKIMKDMHDRAAAQAKRFIQDQKDALSRSRESLARMQEQLQARIDRGRSGGLSGGGSAGLGGSVKLPPTAPIPTPRPSGGMGGGVRLPSTAPIPAPRPSMGSRPSGRGSGVFIGTPVALDLDNDGMVEIRQLSPEPLIDQVQESGCETSQPRFDWNGDGAGEQTAWVGSSDGLLAIDLAADGSAGSDGEINQAHEIAFAQWKTEDEIASENAAEDQSATRGAITDLEGLRRVFDTNHDDMLDAQDARWSEFRVWQDANQDGVSDPGELRSLDQAGIKLLHLLPSPEDAQAFADGSSISGTSHFETGDGKRGLVADVSLAYRPNELASNAA